MDRKEIVDYLAKKVFNGEYEFPGFVVNRSPYYVMLKNKQIYFIDDYGKLVESYKISPEDAFVFIDLVQHTISMSYDDPVAYLFPLISYPGINEIIDSYLVKLGFYRNIYFDYEIYPATSLKYDCIVVFFSDKLVIELTDIDTMATNTGLRKIIVDVLGKSILTQKKINYNQREEIERKLREQKLFAGHDVYEVQEIIQRYYLKQNMSLAKEVLAITDAYNRIFQPYRVVYDTKTKQQMLI